VGKIKKRMSFIDALRHERVILAEGAVIERLRRDGRVPLDPHVDNTALLFTTEGRAALADIYREYLTISNAANLPMIVLTPTWRANPERLVRAKLGDVRTVNREAVAFMRELRGECASYGKRVWIGGLMGPCGDAYDSPTALREDEADAFHTAQADALSDAGVDFLLPATLPALSEAVGLARAMARSAQPYLLSFVLRPSGTLLDGTPLHEAVARIDLEVAPAPFGYFINCVHPANLITALSSEMQFAPTLISRIVGFQANTSRRSPEELNNAAELDSETSEEFAERMHEVHRQFSIKILGGCCGTDARHIRALAERMKNAE
jgi:homocysteine S-methyltransferase